MSKFVIPFPRRIVAAAAIFLLAPMLVVLPGHDPEAGAADQDFTFEGGGFGHTVGLSQYGAYGMAKLDGADSDQILSHYFTGTSTEVLGQGAAAAQPLWVNLESEAKSLTLRPRAITSPGTPLIVTRGDATYTVPIGETIQIRIVEAGSCRVTTSDVDETGSCDLDLSWDGDLDQPTTRVAIHRVNYSSANSEGSPCELLDWNAAPSVNRECAYAHGDLHIRPDGDSAAFHLVLKIDVDDYVLGVSEMPYYWGRSGGYEALKAQAVAARSYAISRQVERGNPQNRPGCWCQVVDTGVDQRYVGWGHSGLGQQQWLDAARETAGEVVTHPSVQRGGKKIAIGALYGSSSYGRTEPSATVYGTDRPYLVSVDDHWSVDPAVGNPRATWTKTLSGSTLAAAVGVPAGRKVVEAEIIECSPSGAAARVRFTDSETATTTLTTQALRSLLGMSSPQLTAINGVSPCDGLGDDGGGGGPGGDSGDLTALDLEIDDNDAGDSSGNGDGRAQCNETVELRTRIGNSGDATATRVAATLSTSDPYLSIVHNTTSDFPDIPADGSGTNRNDWDLAIGPGAPAGYEAVLELSVTTADGGPWTLEYKLPIECEGGPGAGSLNVASVTVDDGTTGDSVGNDDQRAQCGETIELYVTLENQSGLTLRSINADFSTTDSKVTLLHNADSAYPDMSNGGRGRNQNDWDMRIAGSTPDGHVISATLTVVAAGGGLWAVPVEIPVECDGGGGGDSPTGLEIAGTTVDDGVRGDSRGNNDKRAQCGETIELYVALENTAAGTVSGLNADFATSDPYLRILYNRTSPYPELGPSAVRDNTNDWDMLVASNAPDGHRAHFTLTVTNSAGERVALNGTFQIDCGGGGGDDGGGGTGDIEVGAFTVDDGVRGDSIGNNDKRAQCGETIELYIAIENKGNGTLRGVTAELIDRSGQSGLLYNATSSYGDIVAGRAVENENDWDIWIDDRATGTISYRLRVSTAGGFAGEFPIEVPVSCG
jgi:SpoIID/LytB domain protein